MASKDARRRGAAASAPSEEPAAEAEEAWLELPLGVGRARQTVSEAAVTHAELQQAAVACITQAVAYLPVSPHVSLYLPVSPYISLYLPISPYISLYLPISP